MSKPETLYDLCDQVCEHIAERPLNYYQGWWAKKAKDVPGIDEHPEACGTAYCRAGWMMAILENKPQEYTEPWQRSPISVKAHALFNDAGVPEDDVRELFSGTAVKGMPGTANYVEDGIHGMREFMAKHEDKLRARKL